MELFQSPSIAVIYHEQNYKWIRYYGFLYQMAIAWCFIRLPLKNLSFEPILPT